MCTLAIDAVTPNPDQPRKHFADEALEALATSLRARGVLQPVLVRPLGDGRFALIAGERRWRAAQLAGLTELPAFVRGDTDDATALELALIENAAREDLTPVEEARTLSTLINDLGLTQGALGKRIGRSRADVANTLRLLDLPDEVLDLISEGRLSKGHGKSLLVAKTAEQRINLAQRAVAKNWSVRQLERAIQGTPKKSSKRTETNRAVADELNARAAHAIDLPVSVRALSEGFAVRVVAADRETAEQILAHLRDSAAPDTSQR
ncbi:ParB family chromosome partitioning protein [Solirubrobacter pauli]|uniref:ParB family chromosome partitioning protein n=1 Tax=Solirubrobacter pauli TaxID=166793 RepID=A0A660LCR3_9ACTN|nr:ParB/RepB/Spo0J family partition protein [Solirubrobacter pauli]RKQ90834.1 ParB family chromosome partitioning protein [Solirubrobacter pauli]